MAERKQFFDVFPGFHCVSDLTELFQHVYVTDAVFVKSEKLLKVHIDSTILLPKNEIYNMENALSDFIFQNKMRVRLMEHYTLSQQYNIQTLTDLYKDSILLELSKESSVLYRFLIKAEWFIDSNVITITLVDNFVTKTRSTELKSYLQKVYKERFDFDVQVGFLFTEEQKNTIRQAAEHRLNREIASIMEKQVTEEDSNTNSQSSDKTSSENDIKLKEKEKKDKKKSQKLEFHQSAKEKWKGQSFQRNKVRDPEVLFGFNVEGKELSISELNEATGECVIHGKIFDIEVKELRNGTKQLIIFDITDFTDSISGKLFLNPDDWNLLKEDFKVGGFYKIKAIPERDQYSKELSLVSVSGLKAIPDFTTKREDHALEKRVELHMHTVYSDNDSVVDVKKIIARAKEWGHPAIAITDHGVAQAFPVANHCIKSDDPFKIIYGVEGYFVDDLDDFVLRPKGQSLEDSFVVFDIETTGLNPNVSKLIEIGAVKIVNGEVTEHFSKFINPQIPIPYNTTKLTGITDEMVLEAQTIDVVLPEFLDFVGESVLVAHNAAFDTKFIKKNAKNMGIVIENTVVDTVSLAHILCPELGKYTLDRLCKHLGIKLENHHRALDDATATATMFIRFLNMLKERAVYTIDELNDLGEASPETIKKSKRYHGIILAKNEIGRVNLNRLISASHVDYFNVRPIMPKSLIRKYREGLILGSACESGELFSALLNDYDEEEVDRIVRFYDYLEIQPVGNNTFMISNEKIPNINSIDDIKDINRRIVKLGDDYNKPVVATCDVHFLDPDDSIYRAVLMASKGFKDADDQPPLFFRTTEEMLAEFEYLGSDKAKEVVIDNTIKIANRIEKIHPVSPDKCPPVIQDSDKELREICYNKAHEIYGPNLPEKVTSRLEKELNSIIGNGYAVMYIIAQKLVWDSNDHGYLVGSRGSVGSSFVATMSGITEVNPLSAHYICPKCYYVDFESDLVKSYSGTSGCDLPDMTCPNCGTQLNKEGHDIPFETFLGFYGDKEPDIDLNFSGEYQANAHAYTEELFGKGHAFRAGTIGTIADKTAEQLVYKYYEERNVIKRKCELKRIGKGCVGVKRTTGQHPGGIVVVPGDREIYEFTPIQKPANDTKTNTITTHFEYHSIDTNLLKLDILGHDDPTIIRRLEDITGIDAKTISLDDKKVMSIFHSPEALGIAPEDIGGTKTGSLGVPEFGTDFVIQMLVDTKPKNFSDLVRISGLSHGTDVWLNNAQTLIAEGKTELSGAICCRDDIMVYLIHMELEPGLAFKIMESVRKGKGLTPDMEAEMVAHNVPDWYIWSCKQIKYMFPKAHAAAYVMMAWRIAWYKVNYPLAYYTAYFSIRAKAFNYETMCRGKDKLEYYMKEINGKSKEERTGAEEDSMREMRMAQEMYARGFEFLAIDIYRADDVNCLIIDGKIMPPFDSVEGVAGKAASQIKEAVKELRKEDPNAKFISKEDLRLRSGIGKSTIEKMSALGILDGMPETSQLSIFDF